MQFAARSGAGPHDVARVLRNFGFHQNDMKHGLSLLLKRAARMIRQLSYLFYPIRADLASKSQNVRHFSRRGKNRLKKLDFSNAIGYTICVKKTKFVQYKRLAPQALFVFRTTQSDYTHYPYFFSFVLGEQHVARRAVLLFYKKRKAFPLSFYTAQSRSLSILPFALSYS